jgi:hypothetical protein
VSTCSGRCSKSVTWSPSLIMRYTTVGSSISVGSQTSFLWAGQSKGLAAMTTSHRNSSRKISPVSKSHALMNGQVIILWKKHWSFRCYCCSTYVLLGIILYY